MQPLALTITTATRPGSTAVPSEDRVRHGPSLVVVADGVTTTAPGAAAGGAAYADLLTAEVAEAAEDRSVELTWALATAIDCTARRLGLGPETVPGRTPQATVAVGRENAGYWEAAVIGDCMVAAVRTGRRDHHALTDDRLAALIRDLPERNEQRERLASGEGRIGDPADRHLTAKIMASLTGRVNTPRGYWIASSDPRAGTQARTARWPLDEISDILLSTDGGSRTVDLYGIHSWDEVAQLCRLSGPGAVLDLVRHADEADARGHRWPRAKTSDDMTLAHIKVPPGQAVVTTAYPHRRPGADRSR